MNLTERFPAHAPDSVALIVGADSVTYGELADRVARWRGGLAAAGLEKGSVVGLVAGNSETFIVAYLAIISAGMIVVPLNPASPALELRRELEAVSCDLIVVGPAGLGCWGEIGDLTGLGVAMVIGSGDLPLSVLDEAEPLPGSESDDDDPAVLLFTSGTAGSPKAAVLTHKNLWSSILSILSAQPALMEQEQTALAVIPLFHVFGLNAIVNLSLFLGTKIVLAEYESPAHTAELVKRHGATQLAGSPNLWAALLAEPGLVPDDFATLTRAVSGAAKLDPAVTVGLSERLGIDLKEGYGLTETCAVVASGLGTDCPVGSVGQVLPGVQVRLVDAAGSDVLVGDPGEVIVKGDNVSPGYWQDPESTSRTRNSEGWLMTGDLAIVDDSGNLSIIDRLKDLIIVSGFNVHPAEVEAVLTGHDAVSEAAVHGASDSATGETIVAHVVPAVGATIDPLDLMNYCSARLARYKIPRQILVTSELPKTTIGKVRKRDLTLGD